MHRKISALALSLLLGLALVPVALADDPPPAGDQQAAAGQGGKQGGGRRLGRLRNRLGGMRKHRRHKKHQQGADAQNGAQTAPPQSN